MGKGRDLRSGAVGGVLSEGETSVGEGVLCGGGRLPLAGETSLWGGSSVGGGALPMLPSAQEAICSVQELRQLGPSSTHHVPSQGDPGPGRAGGRQTTLGKRSARFLVGKAGALLARLTGQWRALTQRWPRAFEMTLAKATVACFHLVPSRATEPMQGATAVPVLSNNTCSLDKAMGLSPLLFRPQ